MTNQRLHCRILISRQKHCKIRRFSALPLSHKLVYLFHFRISLMYLKDNKLKAFSLKSVSIFKPTHSLCTAAPPLKKKSERSSDKLLSDFFF